MSKARRNKYLKNRRNYVTSFYNNAELDEFLHPPKNPTHEFINDSIKILLNNTIIHDLTKYRLYIHDDIIIAKLHSYLDFYAYVRTIGIKIVSNKDNNSIAFSIYFSIYDRWYYPALIINKNESIENTCNIIKEHLNKVIKNPVNEIPQKEINFIENMVDIDECITLILNLKSVVSKIPYCKYLISHKKCDYIISTAIDINKDINFFGTTSKITCGIVLKYLNPHKYRLFDKNLIKLLIGYLI